MFTGNKHNQRINVSLWNIIVCVLSRFTCVQLFATLWTVAQQAPLSMGLSSQGYWSGLPFPIPGDFPEPGIEPASLVSPALAGGWILYQLSHKGTPALAKSKRNF